MALRYFASVCHRPAAVLLRPYLDHDESEVREAACTLAAVIGTRSNIERLSELCNDTCAEVIDAALIALGNLGYRPVKKILESRLQTASIDEISKIVDALVPVSDEETAVCLGRLVERISDENVRCVVAEALAELDGRAAVTWLLRLVDDPCPAIRQVCQRRSKSTPLAGVKMHHWGGVNLDHMGWQIVAFPVVPVVHRRDPRGLRSARLGR